MKRKWFPGLFDLTRPFKNPRTLERMKYSRMTRLTLDSIVLHFRFANLPIIRRFHPWVDRERTRIYIIPVNKALERGKDVVLPYQIVEKFIDRSSDHTIIEFCGCRTAYGCKDYPHNVGCLMLGPDSKKIKGPFARSVSKEEAKEHMKKAVEANLTPIIGKARVDNFIFGIPDNHRLFTVCFCCECCCLGQIYKYMPPEERNIQFNRLEGLEVWVDEEKCEGCGTCVEHCFLDLMTMVDGKARISEDCRGCGRCARACPEDAIQLRLNNPDFIAQAMKHIESKVELA
ncbi:MAG: 4Fe-4S binding protein [Deltaproteobacteria bacterium]|nr:MAG: 4Fe-4S binding protein [Deltaproteobacteria bacterium]